MYYAPSLRLSWNPIGIPGFTHVYPSHSNWMSYIEAAAKAGWPEGVGASLLHGSWTVRTTHGAMREGLELLARQGAMPLALDRYDQKDIHITPAGPNARAVHQGIMNIVRKYHETMILPPRTAMDTASDQSELPLAAKTLRLANVKHLTVGQRSVMVPLIPMKKAGQALAIETAERLARLVEEGFPFAQAEIWLKKMAPETYADLRRKHSPATTQDKLPAARSSKSRHDHP